MFLQFQMSDLSSQRVPYKQIEWKSPDTPESIVLVALNPKPNEWKTQTLRKPIRRKGKTDSDIEDGHNERRDQILHLFGDGDGFAGALHSDMFDMNQRARESEGSRGAGRESHESNPIQMELLWAALRKSRRSFWELFHFVSSFL
jgi:hypothetical protein